MRAVILALALGSANGALYDATFATAGYPEIAGYTPFSNVVPHARIDISQFALEKALKGKQVVKYAGAATGAYATPTVVDGGGDFTTPANEAMPSDLSGASNGEQHYDLAYDLYSLGGGGSSIYASYKGTVDTNYDPSGGGANAVMSGTTKNYMCHQLDFTPTGRASQTATDNFLLGTPKELYDDATTKEYKIYINDMASPAWEKCGMLGATTQAEIDAGSLTSYIAPFSEPITVVGTDVADDYGCPPGSNPGFDGAAKVVCEYYGEYGNSTTRDNSKDVAFDFTSLSIKGRHLMGFSTGGAAKMMNHNMGEFNDYKAFHGNDKNAETMNDEAIKLAFNALRSGTKATQAFSKCLTSTDVDPDPLTPAGCTCATYSTDGTGCLVDPTEDDATACTDGQIGFVAGSPRSNGVTSAACSAVAGDSAHHVQGSSICKDKDTRKAYIPVGATYADQVLNCESTNGKVTEMQGVDPDFLKQVIKKISNYGNAWMYAIYEFVDAIKDCNLGIIDNNEAGVHAWDEGVAFYTGSMANAQGFGTGVTPTNGVMIYNLANKRCQNFGTCTKNAAFTPTGGSECTTTSPYCGNSKVNTELFPLFVAGQFACSTGDCIGAQENLDKIIPLMRVPLIQGTLRYAYKVGETLAAGLTEIGEGYAFMMAVVHAVGKCNAADGKLIYDAMETTGPSGLGGGHTFADVKQAFENNYACMGITCADVGGLYNSGTESAFPGAGACTDPAATVPAPAPAAPAPAPVPVPVVTNAPTVSGEALPDWALYAMGGGAGLLLILFGLVCSYKSSKDTTLQMYKELGAHLKKEGAIANEGL